MTDERHPQDVGDAAMTPKSEATAERHDALVERLFGCVPLPKKLRSFPHACAVSPT
jgi:hypothetical protein